MIYGRNGRVRGEKRAFLRGWVANPRRTGALMPSGSALASLITAEIDPAVGNVIELGPGTGAFTRALLERGVAERDLTLIEASSEFAQRMAERHPNARVFFEDATRLTSLASQLPVHGAAISGLPLLAMPPRSVLRILRGTFTLLSDEGSLFQFTYGWRCPVHARILATLGLKAVRTGTVLRNFPPASVYRIERQR